MLNAVVFFLMQRMRLSTYVANRLGRSRFGDRLSRAIAAAEDIDQQFERFYSSHRGRLSASFLFAMANWIFDVVEVWLIVHLIGFDLNFSEVWMVECMVQLVRTVTFFIPAGLGTQEGAFLVGVGMLTGAPAAGVAVALVRRFRDLLWIGVSLLLATLFDVAPGRHGTREMDPG